MWVGGWNLLFEVHGLDWYDPQSDMSTFVSRIYFYNVKKMLVWCFVCPGMVICP